MSDLKEDALKADVPRAEIWKCQACGCEHEVPRNLSHPIVQQVLALVDAEMVEARRMAKSWANNDYRAEAGTEQARAMGIQSMRNAIVRHFK